MNEETLLLVRFIVPNKKDDVTLNFSRIIAICIPKIPEFCPDGRGRCILFPWSEGVAGFLLLFAAHLVQLFQAIFVAYNVDKCIGVSDYLLWRMLDV